MAFKMSGMNFGEGTGYRAPQLNPRVIPPGPQRKIEGKKSRVEYAKENKTPGISKVEGEGSPQKMVGESSPQKQIKLPGRLGVVQKVIQTGIKGGKKVLKPGLKTKIIDGIKKVWSKVPGKGWIIPTAAYYIGKASGGGDDDKKMTKTVEEKVKTETPIDKKSDQMPDSDWKKGQEKAKSKGEDLDALVKKREGLEKGSDEWKRNQNKINAALGSSKRYDVGAAKKASASKIEGTKKRGGLIGDKKVERETFDDGTAKETKTKGKSAVEGKKIKTREYDSSGNLVTKTKEKYGKKVTGAGETGDWHTGRRKKKKITTKTDTHVTKTKIKDKKDKPAKTKTRKRRFVKLGKMLAGKRSGQKT